jgi:uncharacterized protein (DUF3084 family)
MAKAQNKIYHSDFWSLAMRSDDQRVQQYRQEIGNQDAIITAKHAIIVAKETMIEVLQRRVQNLNDEYHNKHFNRKVTTSVDVAKLEQASDS